MNQSRSIPVYWKKATRDFWNHRARTSLVVLAIALGISAFLAVLASYAILTRELNRGYLATDPASAILLVNNVDDRLINAVRANPAVAEVEARRVVSGQMKAGPAQWQNLTLFVLRDFNDIRLDKLSPQDGAWPPAAGEILIERDAFQVAHAKIGDLVTVKTASGSERELRVSGSVHDVGQAQARMENIVYGYITLGTLDELGERPYLDRLGILVSQDRLDEGHIREVAQQVKGIAEGMGQPVRRVDIPKPGKHPHADLMGLLLLAMSSFGLFALIMSAMLVVNLLTALMNAEIRQIGVMKAIGGTRAQISCIYFAQALLVGIVAILVAVPAGIAGARALCRYLAVFLNFDITSFAIPTWVFLLSAAVGLLVPILAAARPIWRGASISVREALDDFEISREVFEVGPVDRALAGIGGITRPLVLAIRNSLRRRSRLKLTLSALAVSGVFFMAALNLRGSIIATLDGLFRLRKYDLTVRLASMAPTDKIERAIRSTPGIASAESWIIAEGSIPENPRPSPGPGGPDSQKSNDGQNAGPVHATNNSNGATTVEGDRFTMIGLPPETKMQAMNIIEGRGLLPGDTDAIVVNSSLAAMRRRFAVGNTVELRMGPAQMSWRVVGIAREPFSPPVAYVSRAYIEQAGGHAGMANSIRLSLEKTDAGSIDDVRAALDHNLEQEGVRAAGSSSKADGRIGFDQHMVMIYMFLIIMSSILAGVGGLGLATTMSLNVLERRREMGVMRAIGATPSMVALMVIAEAVFVVMLSWVLAAIAAWPVSKLISAFLTIHVFRSGLDFFFDPLGLLIWLVLSVLVGVAASFLPAWRASRATVREAISYG